MVNELLERLKNGKDKILYQVGNDKITYFEAYSEVKKLSICLEHQGSGPVIIYGHKKKEQFLLILACLVARRAYIPIDLMTPYKRILEIIDASNASLVIWTERIAEFDIPTLDINMLVNDYYQIDKSDHSDNQIAYIIFTSGSTGVSKGVPISYDNLNHFIRWITDKIDVESNLKVLSEASFSFDLSLMDIYFTIYNEGTIIAITEDTKKEISSIYKVIYDTKVNFLVMTPTFIKMLLVDSSFNDKIFLDINDMFFCGEVLEVETVKKIKKAFPNVRIINAYGPTEATCCVSLVEITNEMLDNNLLPVGLINQAAVKVVIEKNEIVLKGDSVFAGYLGINSDKCYKEGKINCYQTGDIGYILDDYLYCNGRMDSQIKYQGYRIEIADIENNLLKVAGVREAVVIPKYKESENVVRLIKAFVVVDNTTEEEIRRALMKFLPHYMIPKSIQIVPKIPVNQNGKYDRKELALWK